MTAIAPSPTASAAGTVDPSATPTTKARPIPVTPSVSTENPNSFGSWLMNTVRAMPFR